MKESKPKDTVLKGAQVAPVRGVDVAENDRNTAKSADTTKGTK